MHIVIERTTFRAFKKLKKTKPWVRLKIQYFTAISIIYVIVLLTTHVFAST